METHSTFEYAEVKYEIIEDRDKERADLENGKLYLSERSISYLERLNVAEVFRNRIKFQNYVGVISFKDLKLEILPKFTKTGERLVEAKSVNNREKILLNLVKMLEFSGWAGIKSTDLTHLGLENDFFEIYVNLFARNLLNLLKTNRDASYIRVSDELRFVKGRINLRKYSNPARMHKIPCEYYERSMDTTINRTLKYVSYLLLRKVNSVENRRLLRNILAILDPVQLAPIRISEVERIVFNRLNSCFEPYVNFCKAFLRDSVLSLQGSDVEFFSFLIPMEALFERFIARAIEEVVGGKYEVNVQTMIGHLAIRNGKKMFALVPDVVLVKDGEFIVIDTKYKLLDPEDRKLGVSQQDLYQMYAYCKELGSSKCILLYPEGINGEINADFKLGKEKIDLHVRTISLENPFDGNRLSDEFKNRLMEILNTEQKIKQ